jgi:putative membrane protein
MKTISQQRRKRSSAVVTRSDCSLRPAFAFAPLRDTILDFTAVSHTTGTTSCVRGALSRWSLSVSIISAVLFIVGLRRCKSLRTWEAFCFAGGWLALFVALVSPLHAWGRVLFSAHMTQHEVLMLVAAPLLVLGRPLVVFLWALPLNWSRRIGNLGKISSINRLWQVITIPFVAWIVHAIALWSWHIPILFEAVQRNEAIHTAQHLSFFISALLFWWALIHGPQGAMGYGAAVLYLFTTSVHSGVLGALLTVARSVWYPSYADSRRRGD